MNRECNDCSEVDWRELVIVTKDDTVNTTYKCQNCGAEGKECVDGETGRSTFTGSLR